MAQPNDFTPLSTHPFSPPRVVGSAVVEIKMLALDDFTDSDAKLASHTRSRPMSSSTRSAKAATVPRSSASKSPASSASSASNPRDAELQ